MKKLILASNNKNKVKEIKEILKNQDIEIKSLKDIGIDIDVIEDGKTFVENAKKKAFEIKNYLKQVGEKNFIVMSDDSGLMVDYLNGEPGIYSARYAGEHGNYKENNIKLLKNLKGVPKEDRKASFVCSVVLIDDNDKEYIFQESIEGYITESEQGVDGFGYDPLFYVEDMNKTFAQMTKEEKNSISHRGKVLKKVKDELKKII